MYVVFILLAELGNDIFNIILFHSTAGRCLFITFFLWKPVFIGSFTKRKRCDFRAPWVHLQQRFLWQCGLHRRGHSPPPRYKNMSLSFCEWDCFVSCSSNTHFALHRTSKARFWPLVDFLFLRKAEPAWHAERIRTSEVSVCNIWTEPHWCQAQALTFLCAAGTGPTQWPTVRWLASPGKWFWKDKSARAATAESPNPRPLQKLYPRPPGLRWRGWWSFVCFHICPCIVYFIMTKSFFFKKNLKYVKRFFILFLLLDNVNDNK